MPRAFPFTAALALALAACGGDAADAPAPAAPSDAQAASAPSPDSQASGTARMEGDVQVVEITAGPGGFRPEVVELRADVPARLVFTRTIENTCATDVQSPTLGIARTELPLNRPVAVEFTPDEAGSFGFACGMDMIKGAVIVRS